MTQTSKLPSRLHHTAYEDSALALFELKTDVVFGA